MTGWKGWFRKSQKKENVLDPRIEFLLGEQSVCRCCGMKNADLLSLAADGPDFLGQNPEKFQNSALLAIEGDILTEDFCRAAEHRLVRAVIEFPIQNCDKVFLFGCWGSLSQENFDLYVEKFDDRDTHELGTAFSWLCNAVPAGQNISVACEMRFQVNAQRPKLFVQDEENPLFAIQRDGLDADTLLEWLKSYGHDPLASQKLN